MVGLLEDLTIILVNEVNIMIKSALRRLVFWVTYPYKHRYELYLSYKNKEITKINYDINKLWLSKYHLFGSEYLYQSYLPLGLRGDRSTNNRIFIYDIVRYLNKSMNCLDLGGNLGFVSLTLSEFVKNIKIIEKDKDVIQIGNRVRKESYVRNVKYMNCDLIEYLRIDRNKYDFIMSLAIHKWIDVNFNYYFKLIDEVLIINGILLLESHDLKNNKSILDIFNCCDKTLRKKYEIIRHGYTDDHRGMQRDFVLLRKNEY